MRKVDIINLGCSKNLVDSENLMTQLRSQGVTVRIDPERVQADLLLINTCGFIGDAKEESINTILQAIEARRSGRVREIRVMGCLVERHGYELQENIPEITHWYGVNDESKILADLGLKLNPEILNQRIHSTPGHYAYLKVSEGCDRNCSFCAIPMIRGKHHSKSIGELTAEASWLAAQGVKELILIAQDLTYYGLDIERKQLLPELVKQLEQIEGIEWIRLHYAYPAKFPMELLKVMRNSEKVCSYLDIPLQHIADPVLKAMNRGINSAETRKLIEKIRKEVPGVALRTTFLVGFPGERDEDFKQLLGFMSDYRFERVGAFAYSHEEGTLAGETLTDSIPDKVKQQRLKELMELQEDISLKFNKGLVGRTIPVIIDREEGGMIIGRTPYDSPEVDQEVMIGKNGREFVGGTIHPIIITDATEYDLYGSPIINAG
ncbi:MAG: 30S ribosomal protein S12 methylthiotransferase RimO [Bacteroidales bacterium]|nr:30S ribosomal protein S12 methylthiotransferase RimO [Bacteroidales bacterium]